MYVCIYIYIYIRTHIHMLWHGVMWRGALGLVQGHRVGLLGVSCLPDLLPNPTGDSLIRPNI